ncbi:MAG: DUF5343 domain-containing protein [Planctomycetota bacterium]
MPKKKPNKKGKPRNTRPTSSVDNTSKPKYPYSTIPGALRQALALIPEKPRPPKLSIDVLKSWGIKNNNASTILRVMRDVGLLNGSNEPTPEYTEFMTPTSGPLVLGRLIRSRYPQFFEAHHEPHRESADSLRSLFNIHSGGEEKTIQLQMQTFKALCDHATFDGGGSAKSGSGSNATLEPVSARDSAGGAELVRGSGPVIHIDLHIHLPENKSRRDYEAMFEDIARCIYGREEP